jgi:hypothetical protein
MKKMVLQTIAGLFLIGLAAFPLGCGLLDNSHTLTVVNETRGPATFGLDEDIHNLAANQSIEIGEVTSGVHAWAAAYVNSSGRPVLNEGGIDVQGDVTVRITSSGVRL